MSEIREQSPFGGRITVLPAFSSTRLTLASKENMLLFVCKEAVESNLVKLESSCTVILPPTVSVPWRNDLCGDCL